MSPTHQVQTVISHHLTRFDIGSLISEVKAKRHTRRHNDYWNKNMQACLTIKVIGVCVRVHVWVAGI